jgi:transcriptional regulator
MYLPRAFEQTDRPALHALMGAHPLATLVHVGADGAPQADHIPLMYDVGGGPEGSLRGHVARANPLWQRLGDGTPVLAVFCGPQAYVTPSWYASKREHGKVVPTWNYAVVHAHCKARAIDDPQWLRSFLQRLTHVHEAARPEPWRIDDAPAEFTEQLLQAIVGIELTVERLEGKWKVSQNRAAADRQGVAAGLDALGGDEARAMATLVRPAGS